METIATNLPGVLLIKNRCFDDQRGFSKRYTRRGSTKTLALAIDLSRIIFLGQKRTFCEVSTFNLTDLKEN